MAGHCKECYRVHGDHAATCSHVGRKPPRCCVKGAKPETWVLLRDTPAMEDK